ncbi:MAG: hypothetical protein WCB02_15090, partial [Bradyrhizobium sp.]
MMLDLCYKKMESNMSTKLLGAAVMAVFALAVVPANAAKMAMVGCSGPGLEKTESMIDVMADGESKMMAQKEMAMAQDALLS